VVQGLLSHVVELGHSLHGRECKDMKVKRQVGMRE